MTDVSLLIRSWFLVNMPSKPEILWMFSEKLQIFYCQAIESPFRFILGFLWSYDRCYYETPKEFFQLICKMKISPKKNYTTSKLKSFETKNFDIAIKNFNIIIQFSNFFIVLELNNTFANWESIIIKSSCEKLSSFSFFFFHQNRIH